MLCTVDLVIKYLKCLSTGSVFKARFDSNHLLKSPTQAEGNSLYLLLSEKKGPAVGDVAAGRASGPGRPVLDYAASENKDGGVTWV